MMIFNSNTVANDYNFVTFSCRQIKLFEGICLALVGKFLHKEL